MPLKCVHLLNIHSARLYILFYLTFVIQYLVSSKFLILIKLFRPKEKICVFPVTSPKKIG